MGGRVRLDVAYDGEGFEGWQDQPERRTVQGELAAVFTRLGETARPTGSGRTDAGVHALGQVAHVDLERDWDPPILARTLRRMTPGDITVHEVRAVSGAFHARFSAVSRAYHYALGLEHNAFFRKRRWVVETLPDPARAGDELGNLVGENDFASFAKSGGAPSGTGCRISLATWTPFPGGAVVTLVADRFLYGMVRAIVGSLVRGPAGAGRGRLRRILEAGRREAAGEAAPPWGLYLARVRYPGEPEPPDTEPVVARLAGIEAPPGSEA
jgi:tRNA pseudouridine38-40 synthase